MRGFAFWREVLFAAPGVNVTLEPAGRYEPSQDIKKHSEWFETPPTGNLSDTNQSMNQSVPSPEILLQRKLSILQEISSTIILTDNVSTIANLMIDLATSHTQAEKGSLMLLDDNEEFYIMASRGVDPELAQSYRTPLDQGIVGEVAKNKQPVLVKDIQQDDRFSGVRRDRYKTNSFISCPIITKNHLLGVININDRKDGTPFTEADFTLIKILANQAAVALKNAFLMNQLKTKALELEELNRKLLDSDLSKTEFLTRISHELRTPLNSMKGAVYCLKQTANLSPHDQKEFYDILESETGKMVSIVEGQLDFLRIESEAIFLKKSILDLRETLAGVISSRMVRDSLARRNIRIETSLPEKLSNIAGDKVLVTQMFINFIEGLTFSLKEDAKVTITIEENEFVNIHFHVSQAFPDWVISQLFNSKTFFQSDQSDGVLKLYLARKTVDNHGWKMKAENLDQCFHIQLTITKGTRQKAEVALASAMDLYLEFVSEMLDLNTCSIMLTDDLTGDLVIKSSKGIEENIVKRTRIRAGERIAGWVAQEGKPLLVEDVEKDPRFPLRVGNNFYNSKSLLSLPLKVADKTIGVINLNNKKSAKSFNRRDLVLVSLIGERISRLVEMLQEENQKDEDLKQLAINLENLLSAGRRYQKKNPQVLDLVEAVADQLKLDEGLKNDALYTALVYDLGLMLISEGVLNKTKKLSRTETSTIQVHPHTTLDLLSKVEFSDRVKKAILHHHERWDGSGYPDGLKGHQIPILARILAVVDAFTSMIEERPYRSPLSQKDALAEIREGKDSKYDPSVVEAIETVLEA